MANKIALITGGSRGLGKNSAIRLAEKGIDVIITYNTKIDDANAVVSEIESMGRKAVALKLDVGNISSFGSFITQVSQTLKDKWQTEKFDFLINNAGFGATIPFSEATEEDFDKLLNVHFKGVYFLTQKILAIINDQGSIINLSSGTTRFSNPGYSIYASMKGAIEVFTKYLAKELGARGINVNVLAPGAIETDFNNAAIRNNPQLKNMIAANTALGRTGVANDIGGIIAFLCSDEAKWITGQRIEATGGVFM
jgi:NAD(P)-dependent dehydrogenase (short-subunit alcohol dehydrogenase family)